MPHPSSRLDALPMRMGLCWSRLRLPRSHKVLRRLGVWDNRLWQGEKPRICRGCYHGYRMQLDLSDYHQRGAFFYSGLLDASVDLCILHALRKGDTFIDIGANIGMMVLLAARAVGPTGRIIAFEPNPDVFERLQWHISENRLPQVHAHQFALSDHEDTMRLTVPPTHNTGAATLGALPARHRGLTGAMYEVPVRIGDDFFERQPLPPSAPSFIKIDVEGHETAALRGLRRTIEHARPAILLESNVEMLPQNGTSVEELFSLLTDLGYHPLALRMTWSRFRRRWNLVLRRMDTTWRPERTENILFLHPGETHDQRLAPYLR